MADLTYENIDRPYDGFLDRSAEEESPLSSYEENQNAGYDPYAGQDVLKTGQSFRDLTIDTWIKSRSFKPKKQGFFFDGKRGYIEAMFVRAGTIITDSEGARVQIGGFLNGDNVNDIWLFDDTTGGGPGVSGNVASIYFVRTDDADPFNPTLSQYPRFVIEKRKGSLDNDSNVGEVFFDQFAAGSGLNYIFIGRRGSALDMFTNTVSVNAYDGIEFGLHDLPTTIAHWRYDVGHTADDYWIYINMKKNPLYFDDSHYMWWDDTATVYRVNSGSIYTPGDIYAGGNMVIDVADPAFPGLGKVVAAGGGVTGSNIFTTSSDGTPAHTHTVTINTVTLEIDGTPYTLLRV